MYPYWSTPMEFDLRLMRLGPFQPWGFHLRGGLDRPLIVDSVIPWTPAHNRLWIGDQILEIEGHFDCEISSEEAELLSNLKNNYLRLGVRRLPMFSNQYMGTRLASRSLPRPMNTSSNYNRGSYGQFTEVESREKPVNARPETMNGEQEEDVDYTFMQLPVRERRKMFLSGGGPPPQLQTAGVRSMTMPRTRSAPKSYSSAQFDTQSDYGGVKMATRLEDLQAWEPSVQPSWSQGAHAAPRTPQRKASTTGAIVLNPKRASAAPGFPSMDGPIRPQSQFGVSVAKSPSVYSPTSHGGRIYHTVRPTRHSQPAISPSYHPQYSATIRVHDPYGTQQPMQQQSRLVGDGFTRIYPNRVYQQHSSAPPASGRYSGGGGDPWRASYLTIPGRVAQPLRVNVYNSDASSMQYSPTDRSEATWRANSPIYPAYPAHIERSYYTEQQQMTRERYRRGQSVQPPVMAMPARMSYQKPASPRIQRAVTQEVWRPMQAPNWVDSPPRQSRPGRFIAVQKTIPVNRPRTEEVQETAGVSDF